MNYKDQFTPIPLKGTTKHKTFKGHVVLDFIDSRTGKITDHVEGENTFTNALDSLLNSNPFGLGKGVFNNTAVDGTGDVDVTPLTEIALGGVLVYPSFTAPSNLNDFFEPFTNQPTAYASRLNLSDTDTKLGVFNSIESGAVTGGYKFVYDWTTSAGNGVWGAISLCHRRGGQRYYSDYAYMRTLAGCGYYKLGVGGTEIVIGLASNGFYTVERTNPNKVSFYKMSETLVGLFEDFTGAVKTTPDWSKTFSISPAPVTVYSESEDKLYLFSTSGSISIAVTVVDCTDWSETTTTIALNDTIIGTAYTQNSWGVKPAFRSLTYANGYIYALKSDGTAILKIDYSNPANVTSISGTFTVTGNNTIDLATDGVLVYAFMRYGTGPSYVIGADDTAHEIATTVGNNIPLTRRGVWLLSSNYEYNGANKVIGASALSSYMATKYELASSVTKTADKTAKLTYTVTEV